jgi:hypothetical protein
MPNDKDRENVRSRGNARGALHRDTVGSRGNARGALHRDTVRSRGNARGALHRDTLRSRGNARGALHRDTVTISAPSLSQEVDVPRFQGNRHMKVARLSTVGTGRFIPQGNIPGTHFCYRLSRPQDHSATGRIKSITLSGIKPATLRLVA